ncbi:hypothetical protein DY000_02025504 [Brassica cretica]|uniref:IBB domain-containing protein n=1 Tax=Brassica cretica TaxID=69181 RepID=A0ABQ7EI90_BRACR|nr:hypothetical protein DY000_02025504 [Brassica cretica]
MSVNSDERNCEIVVPRRMSRRRSRREKEKADNECSDGVFFLDLKREQRTNDDFTERTVAKSIPEQMSMRRRRREKEKADDRGEKDLIFDR